MTVQNVSMDSTDGGVELQGWIAELQAADEERRAQLMKQCSESSDFVSGVSDLVLQPEPDIELLDMFCEQMVQFARRTDNIHRNFVLHFAPCMIEAYLTAHAARNDQKTVSTLETALISIYNMCTTDERGQLVTTKVRIPTLTRSSIYHDPSNLSSLGLTEPRLLSTRNSQENYTVSIGPYVPIDRIVAQNRHIVLTHILRCYNRRIADMNIESISSYCLMASRLCRCGLSFPATELVSRVFGEDSSETARWRKYHRFDEQQTARLQRQPRILLQQTLLLELLTGLYYAVFNQHALVGIQAIDDIHHRAGYELHPEVLLVTNAIINSLLENPSGRPDEGPMGIRVAPMSTVSSGVKRHAVTNASLKLRRQPEDIPVREAEDQLSASPKTSDNVLHGRVDSSRRSLSPISETEAGSSASSQTGSTKRRESPLARLRKISFSRQSPATEEEAQQQPDSTSPRAPYGVETESHLQETLTPLVLNDTANGLDLPLIDRTAREMDDGGSDVDFTAHVTLQRQGSSDTDDTLVPRIEVRRGSTDRTKTSAVETLL